MTNLLIEIALNKIKCHVDEAIRLQEEVEAAANQMSVRVVQMPRALHAKLRAANHHLKCAQAIEQVGLSKAVLFYKSLE